MKLITILPLAALATSFVIPDNEVMSQITVESPQSSTGLWDSLPSKKRIIDTVKDRIGCHGKSNGNALDHAFESSWMQEAEASNDKTSIGEAFDVDGWLSSEVDGSFEMEDPHQHPHHPRPRHGHHSDHDHGHQANLTVYQLIAESNYTTKLAELINKFPDLVELLNGTAANFTVFAPTDRAFAKLPDHAKDAPDKLIKMVLGYHVSSDYYPAFKVLASNTIPSLLVTEFLPGPQRLSIDLSLRGLTVNFLTRVIAINIVGLSSIHILLLTF